MSHGWLAPRPDIPRDESWFGLYLDPGLPTRWEEFTLARDALESRTPGRVLDAGCGFEPGVHVMPEIAASVGWQVEALDILEGRWRQVASGMPDFPPHPRINRREIDIRATDYEDDTFDAYLNISVLEHMDAKDRRSTLNEAVRVLRPGGLMVVTADGLWPHLGLDGFDFCGPVIPPAPLKNDLGQPISFLVGSKCT